MVVSWRYEWDNRCAHFCMSGYARHTIWESVISFIPSWNYQNQLSILKYTPNFMVSYCYQYYIKRSQLIRKRGLSFRLLVFLQNYFTCTVIQWDQIYTPLSEAASSSLFSVSQQWLGSDETCRCADSSETRCLPMWWVPFSNRLAKILQIKNLVNIWAVARQNKQNDLCAQWRLRSAGVWSMSLLCSQWVAKGPSFLHADSEDSDQTGLSGCPGWYESSQGA